MHATSSTTSSSSGMTAVVSDDESFSIADPTIQAIKKVAPIVFRESCATHKRESILSANTSILLDFKKVETPDINATLFKKVTTQLYGKGFVRVCQTQNIAVIKYKFYCDLFKRSHLQRKKIKFITKKNPVFRALTQKMKDKLFCNSPTPIGEGHLQVKVRPSDFALKFKAMYQTVKP